jgi:purine-binding chemotaxis protein CheW
MIDDKQKSKQTYLSFNIGGEVFCVNTNKVLNIIELPKIVKIPQSPDYMLGIINLRGEVLPVIDSRIKFGIPVTEFTLNTNIVVMDILMNEEFVHIGVLVDAALEVFEISDESILPLPGLGSRYRSEFINGVIKQGEDFIMLLDMDKALTSDELIMITNSTSDAGQNINENNSIIN